MVENKINQNTKDLNIMITSNGLYSVKGEFKELKEGDKIKIENDKNIIVVKIR